VPRGDFNVGQSINKFVRLPMTLPSGTTSLQRHAVWFGAFDYTTHNTHDPHTTRG
jgi:hypothetical protein